MSKEVPREPIKVRTLRFCRPHDVPGSKVTSALTSSDQKNTNRHTIEYLPWMRHFRVTYHSAHQGVEACFVHEAHVAFWSPSE